MYFVEKTKGVNLARQFDYLLFVSVLALSILGIIALRSASLSMQNGTRLMITQIVSLLIGIVVSLLLSAFDYKDFKTLGIILYIASILLLVAVLVYGTGETSWGSRSWLRFGGIGFQPSELAKITFIIVASIFFERISEGNKKGNVMKLLFYAALPLGLVLKQPDMGTAMVFIFIFAVMVFVCGISYKYIFITLGAFVASLPLLWFFILKEYQKKRILVFFNPELDPQKYGYHVKQSIRTIGSGQIYGKGLFEGIQTQNGVVPERQTDFIFTVIGEELGFIGAMIVILLILIIMLRCIYIAKNSRDAYGSFLVIGMTSMLAFHFIENIGMCIKLLPITGIPLPFISYGGSAMVTNYIAIGVILSVSIRKKKIIFNST